MENEWRRAYVSGDYIEEDEPTKLRGRRKSKDDVGIKNTRGGNND